MLPAGVLSKVEQYLKNRRSAPASTSSRSASRLWPTASSTGVERLLRLTTTASTSSGRTARSCTPLNWTVRRPPATRNPEMSVAPVKPSATTPIRRPWLSSLSRRSRATFHIGSHCFTDRNVTARRRRPEAHSGADVLEGPGAHGVDVLGHGLGGRLWPTSLERVEDRPVLRDRGVLVDVVGVDELPQSVA